MFALEQVALLQILSFVAGALLVLGIGTFVSKLLQPHRPNIHKTSTYESGEAPAAQAWAPFNSRFYGIALVFVLFEVETILLFPWATVWNNQTLNAATGGLWKYYTALSALLFITLLALGLAYVWRKGYFGNKHHTPPLPTVASTIPPHYYEQVNDQYATSTGNVHNRLHTSC